MTKPAGPDDLHEQLLTLALAATAPVAAGIQRRREAGLSIDTKSSATDLVTDTDRWAENTLVDALSQARPDDGFLGEEGTSRSGTSGVRWIIDPIDGTTNFVYDLPGYSVSVAAEVEGEIAVGVVSDPVRRETFTAITGRGSHRNGRPLRVNAIDDLSTSLVGTGFTYQSHIRAEQAIVLARVVPKVRDIRRFGGAALDLCAVACGRLDAYYEIGLSPWDFAAGGLIATEAGAVLTDFTGGSVTVAGDAEHRQTLCAAPALHPQLVDLLDGGN